MPENLENKINQKETEDTGLSLFAELEEKTKHLTGATKEEQKMRILERKGYIIPQAERIRHYVNYVLEIIEKETEENKTKKILEILEKDRIFSKEELEVLIIGEKATEQDGISQEDEKEIEKVIEKDKSAGRWIKKILFLGMLLLAPFSGKKGPTSPEKTLPEKQKIENIITSEKELLEKLPADLEKPVEFFKNLEFIKGTFYVLDKSDRKRPTLYELTKEGKIVWKEIVGIGKEEGDNTKGMTTPAGIYMLSDWLMPEDIELYGDSGVFRLLGYSISGERMGDIGIHRIYPLEEKERTEKMLDTASSKGISLRCINVFEKPFKEHIVLLFYKMGGTGKLFFVIMQEKNDFDEEKWKNIAQKMNKDVKILEK